MTLTNIRSNNNAPLRLVIHGGAGAVQRDKLKPERERTFMKVLTQSLHAGHAVLAAGGSSIDAVVAAIVIMEDSPVFNAGKGAVFSHEGNNELDASIMDGATHMAGAVAAVTTIRNPIRAARAVMMHSSHVLLIGRGAEEFAAEQALEIVEPSFFYSQRRWDQLQKAITKERIALDHDLETDSWEENNDKHGTVGAVALDCHGNLAAGTSTGGLTNKRFGRVGDTPIIGAGTYADNHSVAVSATGTGEMFIRTVAGFNTAARIKLQNMPLTEAADHTLAEIATIGGEGGLILLNAQGDYTMRFNTNGMFRGAIGNDGIAYTGVFSGAESLAACSTSD